MKLNKGESLGDGITMHRVRDAKPFYAGMELEDGRVVYGVDWISGVVYVRPASYKGEVDAR
jgi:hypothetical protein